MESPSAMTTFVPAAAEVSTPERKYQCSYVFADGSSVVETGKFAAR